jgi:cell division transport system permease protein
VAAGAGARTRRIGLLARWRGWQRHHSLSAADSLIRILQHPAGSLVTWLVIGIAMALPAGLWLALENLSSLNTRVEQPTQLSVFLVREVPLDHARGLASKLEGRADIAAVKLLPREAALDEFLALSGLGSIAQGLPGNPLPHLLLVSPSRADAEGAAALARELSQDPDIAEVVVDARWLQRLERLMALARRVVQLLGMTLLAAVVLVLGNTIRLSIEGRREEIEVIKLVGGSDAFVRRPLLYTGLWYGLGGGVVAVLLLSLGVWLLAAPTAELAAAYDSSFALRGFGIVDSLQLVLMGGGLGLAGAWLAVARHLKDIEPHPL